MGNAVSTISRNLRDGTLVIKDGTTPTPQSLTLTLDEGDLLFIQKKQTLDIEDRGTLDHTRPGTQQPSELRFSAKWTQLTGKHISSGNALQLYEFLNFLSGTSAVSTSGTGQQETLDFHFTVDDPDSSNDELLVFPKVYIEQLQMGEGDRSNIIRFVGRTHAQRPTITRP